MYNPLDDMLRKLEERGKSAPNDDLATQRAYIIEAAKRQGIDPAVALKVWENEGKGAWQSNLRGGAYGKREPSYGPYQLLRGGGDTGYGPGLGNEAPFDVSDPSTWRQNVDYALGYAKKNGWGPWAGAKAAGITGRMGIGDNRRMAGPDVLGTTPDTPVPQMAQPQASPSPMAVARGAARTGLGILDALNPKPDENAQAQMAQANAQADERRRAWAIQNGYF